MIEKAQPFKMWTKIPYRRALSRLGVTIAPIRYGRFIRVRPTPWVVANRVERAKVAMKPDRIQLDQFTVAPSRGPSAGHHHLAFTSSGLELPSEALSGRCASCCSPVRR